MTISDVKKKAIEKNMDDNVVLSTLFIQHALASSDDNMQVVLSDEARDNALFFQRYFPSLARDVTITEYGSNGKTTKVIRSRYFVSWLFPFLRISENVANVLFCFGIGCIISTLLVVILFLKNAPISNRYIILRILGGGLASSCIFLIIIAGGNLLWENTSDIKGFSIGVISALGAIYCERFKQIISLGFFKNQEIE